MWSKVGERSLFGLDMIKDVEEQVAKVRENLKAAQSRQNSYADTRQRPLEFQPGDFVYLKVSLIGHSEIPSQRKTSTTIHRAIRDY
jgi:hypothetical protein